MNALKLLDFVETPAFALVFPESGPPCFAFWNARAEHVTGLDRDAVIGQVPTDTMGALATPLMSHSWKATPGEVSVDGLGTVKLVSLPDRRTVIGTVMTSASQQVDQEREMFLGLAIHDARAPLRNISFLCEKLLTEFPEPNDGRNREVRQVRGIAERTLRMSDEILTSVQAASLAASNAVDVELQPLCDLIFATLDPWGVHRMICSNAVLEVERPVLQVVLRNLIDNAIQHGDKSSSLSIHIKATAGADGRINIHVEDDGRGFSDAALAFFANGEVRRGGGFGLYGVRRLLEARGGQIQVERHPKGSGSVVTATLPGRILDLADHVARAS